MNTENLEKNIVLEGLSIFKSAKNKEGIFDKQYWLGKMMEWVMKDPSFKVDMFRFVDVLPTLVTDEQVAKHIREYLLKNDRDIPFLMSTALKAASFSLGKSIASSAIRKNVKEMAMRFIAGQDLEDATPVLKKLHEQGYSFTIDILGEKTLSEKEADLYLDRYLYLIKTLPSVIKLPPGSHNVSIKLSALSAQLREEAPESSVADAMRRVLPLLRKAKECGVFINFDVETFASNEIIYELFSKVALSDEFKSWPHLGIVVQGYLRESKNHVEQLIKLCRMRKSPITIRLVKGAYWDYEVVKAKSHGHEIPVFLNKAQTDQNYEMLCRLLLDNKDVLRPAFASHNIRSLSQAIVYAQSRGISKNDYEIQMLYGMSQGEGKVLLDRGHQVRIYVPVGDMIPGMSYLVRRLLENTSQMGFLRLSQHEQKDQESLLKSPIVAPMPEEPLRSGFVNISTLDFTYKSVRDELSNKILKTKDSFPQKVPVVISSARQSCEKTLKKFSPNDASLISTIDLAQKSHAEKSVAACVQAFPSLRNLDLSTRIEHLLKLADLLEKDRIQLSALICHEVGKTWAEADADVAESIDFCRFYAERARIELLPQKLGVVEGEHNLLTYQGRGPTVIIAPWNFPLAILTGMSVAAYVAGNPIIMKPAEQSSMVAFALYERMEKAQFLKDSFHFLPANGEEIGPLLCGHKDIANICFTGSMKVGHEIMKISSTVIEGQVQMKRVICEMGGKNAIIIDDDADLDEAVLGVINSAFSYAGQKCSAASRLLLVGPITDSFIERFIESTSSLKIGPSTDPESFMGPVIDQEAFDRLNFLINKFKNDVAVKILYQGPKVGGGYFVAPVILEVSDPEHWVMQEELFGPIISLMRVPDLKQAVKIANTSRFALTSALYSRSPQNIGYVREHLMAGNLYINQKCTGALVNRQPFGGFKMSGTGIKAGGYSYLLNFVDAKVVSENTMRRGFTPEVSL